MKLNRVIISGGGTGGHIFPAIAIAHEIRHRNPQAEILFVGANGRMEMDKVPQAGYKIEGLNIAGIQRGSILKNIGLPFKLAGSMLKAMGIVRSFKPEVAVGVGGYASGPLLRAAAWLGIPTVIQEQNSFAGITNKMLAGNAKVICTAYKGMENIFPKDKVVLTGNPVRAQIASLKVSKAEALNEFLLQEASPVLLVIGGSLGAKTINEAIISALPLLKNEPVQVLWQTGKSYYDRCVQAAAEIPNVKVHQFIDRMDAAYAAADIIISRAGALSISELQLIGKPVILVPSPNVAEDHQTHNAMALVNNHAAKMIRDQEASTSLVREALQLLADRKLSETLSKNILLMGIPDATQRIVNEIEKAVNQ